MSDNPQQGLHRGLRNIVLPSAFFWVMIILYPLATLIGMLALIILIALVCAFWDKVYNYFHQNDEKGLRYPARRR